VFKKGKLIHHLHTKHVTRNVFECSNKNSKKKTKNISEFRNNSAFKKEKRARPLQRTAMKCSYP